MERFFETVVNMSITGRVVILAVLLVRVLLKRSPKIFSYLLWSVVLFRLVCPYALTTSFGIPQTIVHSTSYIQNEWQNTQSNEVVKGLEESADLEQTKETSLYNGQVSDVVKQKEKDNIWQNNLIGNRILRGAKYVWFVGIILLSGYSLISYLHLKKLLAAAQHRKDNIYEVDALPTPFVLGFFKPCIYLPTGIQGEEREYVLAHERMHIRRLDYLVKSVGFLVVILHWMNPLVWVAFGCMTKDMEMSCDEAVIKSFGTQIKKEYSMSLLHMAMPQKYMNFAPLAFGEGNVKSRIQNVLKYKKAGAGILAVGVGTLVVVIVIFTTNQATQENQMGVSSVEDIEMEPDSFELPVTTGDTATETDVLTNSTEDGVATMEKQLEKWAQAFCDRDGEAILSMLSETVKQQMQEEGLLDIAGGTASFGLSSPWPMQPEQAYQIKTMNVEDKRAEILYYAVTSEPHVSVWQEKISFSAEGEEIVIQEEELTYLDHISSIEEYRTAYPDEILDDTMMDYEHNGMGQILNDNALLAGSNIYTALFQPDTAALQLLNIDSSAVTARWGYLEEGTEDAFVELTFGQAGDTIQLRMLQPYGSEGIWVPKN